MKKLLIFLLATPSILVANTNHNGTLSKAGKNFFIENKGQWPQEVKFLAKTGGMSAWITDFGVVYDYYEITCNYSEEELTKTLEYENEDFKRKTTSVKGHVVKSTFNQNNSSQRFIGEERQKTYYNYFLGKDESKWASYVPLYEVATVEELYEGIDIKYYFDGGLLRYDFIVRPGADISQISISLKGADNYTLNDKGELELQTSLGKISHNDIVAYQKDSNGENKTINTRLTIKDNKTIGFIAENYDKGKVLIIDPLVFSTFLGGSSAEVVNGITLADDGNIFVIGETRSSDYPVTAGAYDETHNGGGLDVFITKLNPMGTEVLYSTFIGGDGYDWGEDIQINQNGDVFIVGDTDSPNYPVTIGAYDMNYRGDTDAFVTKLNASGTQLDFSTFLGGSDTDYGMRICMDNSENVFVLGDTWSTDYPSSVGAYDRSQNGFRDVVVTKINATGTGIIYSTFLGGYSYDIPCGMAIDSSGNVYVTGMTLSQDFPVTNGAYNERFNGIHDAYVTKLNALGSDLEYSTFLGGSNKDGGEGIAINDSGNAFIVGWTECSDYPVTNGAYDESFNGGRLDIIVTKINASGSNLVYSTFLGGSDDEFPFGIALDDDENVFITGYTSSTNYPVTLGSYDESYNGGDTDAYVTMLNQSGTELEYSTFLGGNDEDYGEDIEINQDGNVFITGYTFSTDYPVTIGSYDENHSGTGRDGFVTKLNVSGAVGLENVIEELAREYSLHQNYPNPFNPVTKIEYQIPENSNVQIKVYNMRSEQLVTLEKGFKEKGFHSVTWDASKFSSGIYIYKMIVGSHTESKKMLFLK